MPTKERVEETETETEIGELPVVNAHDLSTDRTVFTEENNEDGWISTDVTVSIRR